MSIIYDALQKTQQQRDETKIELNAPKRSVNKKILIQIAIVINVLILISLGFVFYPRLAPLFTPKKPVPAHPITKVAKAFIKPVLGGVFVSDDYQMAVINNRTVRTGDVVSGMKVASIEYDGVTLKNGNNTITLH